MKILHTSDWHLGHTLYNYDRMTEQKVMLEQMAEIVRKQKPDVFLLCGDVYHTPQPSAAVQIMFTEAIINIRNAYPEMTIIVTAGNHDSGTKHEIFRTPWRALKVHVIGTLNRENVNEHIIEIPNKGFIMAVPYSNERNFTEDFFQELSKTVRERNIDNLPVVMTAHTTVKGCDFTGHDNASEYIVGGIDSFNIEDLGDYYDYLALGHIHHAQFIHTGRHNVRYCGTPIAISFDENYPHSVSMVEIERHGCIPKVETIEIETPHPLVTLPTKGASSWEEAKELLMKFPDDIPAYIRLNVEIEDFLPVEANAEAATLTERKQCRFCYINTKRRTARTAKMKVMTVQEFQSESPLDIAQRFADDSGKTFDEEMVDLFKEIVKMVEEDKRNS